MLEIYEVFDADDEELLAELQSLQQQLRTSQGANHVQAKLLYDTVRQELEERGLSNKVFQRLGTATGPGPPQLASQLSVASGLGLVSPAAPLGNLPGQQPVQPVAMLYSFGSFGSGAGGAGGGAASGIGPYGHHQYPYHAMAQALPPGASGTAGGSGIAQAVSAMVVATFRQQQQQQQGSQVGPPAGGLAAASDRGYHASYQVNHALASVASIAAPAPGKQHQGQAQVLHVVHTVPPPIQPPASQPLQQPQQHSPQHQPSLSPGGAAQPQAAAAFSPTAPGKVGGAACVRPTGDGGRDEGAVSTGQITLSPDSEDSDAGPEASGAAASGDHQSSPLAAEGSMLSGAGGSGAVGPDGADGTPADGAGGGGGKALTPWEAAMQAFREEQMLLKKARKAIKKGPPAKPVPKKLLVAHPPQQSRPAALGPESSQGSARGAGRLPRPSASNSLSAITAAPASSPGPGSGPGARNAAASSPHGAVALAAASAVAAASASGTGANRALGPPAKAASAPAGAVRQADAVGAESAASKASAPRPASADTSVGSPAGRRPVAQPVEAWGEAEAVAEDQGLSAVQVEPAEGAGQQHEPSEPESVKTDEDSSELMAAAMQEAATARAAAAAAANGPRRRADEADVVTSSDSEPESVSSTESVAPHSQQIQAGSRLQEPDAPMGRREGPNHTASSAAGARTVPEPQRVLEVAGRPQETGVPQRPGQPTRVGANGPPASVSAPVAQRQPQRSGLSGDIADEVATESGSDSDSDGASTCREESAVLDSPGKGAVGPKMTEEAKRRAIAAAAAAAIQGRSAADPQASLPVGADPRLARAVVHAAPMRVDRWADWDLADSSDALSAWATNHEEDPMRGGHLRGMVRPVGHHAPPESLVTGPTGAHGLAASTLQQGRQQGSQPQQQAASPVRAAAPTAGSAAAGSRPASRPELCSPTSAGSLPATCGRKVSSAECRRPGTGNDGGDSGSSDSGAGDGGGAARVRRRGHSAGTTQHLTPSPPPLPPSGMVPAGAISAALGATAAGGNTGANGVAGAATRRPPLPPGPAAQRTAAAAEPSQIVSEGLKRIAPAAAGGLEGSSATAATSERSGCSSPSRPSTEPSNAAQATAAAASASAAYLQHYTVFHEILTVCYSSLPVMLDAAALSSSSVAVVAGSGGGGSRPPSRMVPPSAGLAAGIDLLERYASILARCEAWQAKLAQLTQGSPYEDGPGTSQAPAPASAAEPVAAAAVPQPPSQSQPLPASSRAASARGFASDAGNAGAPGASAQPVQLGASSPRLRPPPAPPPSLRVRYVAVVDDTAHPEVRNVVNAALQLLSPAWTLDPADQVTEAAKPDTSADDDSAGVVPAAAGGSRPATAAVASTCRTASAGGSAGTGGLTGAAAAATGASQAGAAGVGGGGGGGGPRYHMWNVLWSWSVKVRVPLNELLVWQRVNHFAEARQLTRKDLLKKHLARYQAMHNTGRSAALFDRLVPTTFVLPKEAAAFEEAFVRALHGVEPTCVQPVGLNLWIQKPVGLSRGRGISLISSLKKANTSEPMIVQRYLTEPLLVEGFKFDLRLYVLVTSFNPLEAWMYEQGFARFTTLPYTLDESELGNMHVHLTNSSVQRTRAEAGQLPAFLQAAEPAGGSKISLETLRQLLAQQGVEWATLWTRVCEVATAALFAAQDAIPHSPNSFELFGFDMMIDARQKVWLLEVNSSPSMGLDTPLDRVVKPRLIADVLELLAPLPFDRQALATVMRARTNTGRSLRRGTQGLLSGTVSEEREVCCADLQAVLGGAMPRRYGERPRNPGGFTTCLAPSPFHDRLLKLRRPLP